MNRKAKISMAVAFVLLGLAAICFFTRAKEGELQVSFLRVSEDDSNNLIFALTNTSDRRQMYFVQAGATRRSISATMNDCTLQWAVIRSHEMKIIPLPANAVPISWRVDVIYMIPEDDSWLKRTRRKLSAWAIQKGWPRLGERLRPSDYRMARGLIMLGNQPVALESEKGLLEPIRTVHP